MASSILLTPLLNSNERHKMQGDGQHVHGCALGDQIYLCSLRLLVTGACGSVGTFETLQFNASAWGMTNARGLKGHISYNRIL